MFKSPEEMQVLIDLYFDGGANKRKIVTMTGAIVEVPMLTISGLVYFLGFSSRDSFYEYEKKEEFTDILKKARLRIEMNYEELLFDAKCTGAIFALKNLGWEDRSRTDITSGGEKITGINYIIPKNDNNA